MERFIAAKSTPAGKKAVALNKALPSPTKVAMDLLMPRLKILKALSENAHFLKASVSGMSEQSYIEDEIKKGGGLASFLASIKSSDIKKLAAVFENLIDNDFYVRGEGAGGHYEFTPEEKVFMKQEAKSFFARIPLASVLAELEIYKNASNLADHALATELSAIFVGRASFFIEMTTGTLSEEIAKGDGTKLKVEVPKYFFPLEIRLEAASLLHKRSEDLLWGLKARANLRNNLKKKADDGFKTDTSTLIVEDLPDELALWLLEHRKVIEALEANS